MKEFLKIARPLCREKKWDLLAVVAMASVESDRTFEARGNASDPGRVRDFYSRAFERRAPKKPVDYFLAAWDAAPGLPGDTVICLKGERKFRDELDIDGDGKIRVRTLRMLIEGRMLEIGKLPQAETGLSLFDVISSLGLFVLRARLGAF